MEFNIPIFTFTLIRNEESSAIGKSITSLITTYYYKYDEGRNILYYRNPFRYL